jgi:hypothetical protein
MSSCFRFTPEKCAYRRQLALNDVLKVRIVDVGITSAKGHFHYSTGSENIETDDLDTGVVLVSKPLHEVVLVAARTMLGCRMSATVNEFSGSASKRRNRNSRKGDSGEAQKVTSVVLSSPKSSERTVITDGQSNRVCSVDLRQISFLH